MIQSHTVHLETPIKRGDTEITSFQVRKPMGGELRGLSMTQIQMGDISTHITLIPRIATPPLTEADIAAMPADDLADAIDTVVGFFLTRQARALLPNPSTN